MADERIVLVVGARPNFMKAAPVLAALEKLTGARPRLIHTGQHYDRAMSQVMFDELKLPAPDIFLGVGGGSHAEVTGRAMIEIEKVLVEWRPRLAVVFGDINSTLAAALTAAKLDIPVGHVEAGLRSGDRTMPEELNRICTDHLSEQLFVTEPSGVENLRAEGLPPERVHLVGNCMIDTLLACRDSARSCRAVEKRGLKDKGYALVTLHRPANVDSPETLESLVSTLLEIAGHLPVVWPIHPRTRDRMERFGLQARLESARGVLAEPPLSYLEFLDLMDRSRMVLTDSGGIQEETTILDVPCLTLRANTERPVTITDGTNRLVGTAPGAILAAVRDVLEGRVHPGRCPPMWDGHAGERVALLCQRFLSTGV